MFLRHRSTTRLSHRPENRNRFSESYDAWIQSVRACFVRPRRPHVALMGTIAGWHLPASGIELNARAIFAAAGLKYEDLGRVECLPFAEPVELIKNRQLDATLQSAGLGVASIRDLATSVPINVVAVPAEDVAKIRVALSFGGHPQRHLRGAGRGCRDCHRRQISSFTRADVSDENRLSDDEAPVRAVSTSYRRPCRRQGDRPGQGARRHAGANASRRGKILQGEGLLNRGAGPGIAV